MPEGAQTAGGFVNDPLYVAMDAPGRAALVEAATRSRPGGRERGSRRSSSSAPRSSEARCPRRCAPRSPPRSSRTSAPSGERAGCSRASASTRRGRSSTPGSDRPRPIRCGCRGAEPGRHGGRAAAARTAGAAVGVPRVAGDSEGRALGVAHDRELRAVGLADDHGARAPAAAPARCPRGRREVRGVLQVVTSPVTSSTSFTAIGTPSSGRSSPAPGGRRPAARPRARSSMTLRNAQLRVEPLDPLEVEDHELARRDLAAADQLRLAATPANASSSRSMGAIYWHGGTPGRRRHSMPGTPRTTRGPPRAGGLVAETPARSSRRVELTVARSRRDGEAGQAERHAGRSCVNRWPAPGGSSVAAAATSRAGGTAQPGPENRPARVSLVAISYNRRSMRLLIRGRRRRRRGALPRGDDSSAPMSVLPIWRRRPSSTNPPLAAARGRRSFRG